MQISKSIICGDGQDVSKVRFPALSQNQEIVYTINGAAQAVLATIPTTIPTLWYAEVEIACDTPNLTIVIAQGSETAIIYSVGAP